jgi:hypothetical protein
MDVVEFDSKAWLYCAARHTCHICLLVEPSTEVLELDVTDQHLTGSAKAPIVPVILGNSWSRIRTFNEEVAEGDMADVSPTSAAGLILGFISFLENRRTNPCFDVCAIMHILVIARDMNLINGDVFHGRIFKILP